jgi:small-conductance mechanosensitive channel
MIPLTEWLGQAELFGNPWRSWLTAAASALVGYLVVRGVLGFTAARLRLRQQRAPNGARAVALALLHATRRWLVLLLAVLLALETLAFRPRLTSALGHASIGVVGLQLALWANALIALWLRHAEPGRLPINRVLAGMLSWIAQLLIWTVLLLFFLGNVGDNVTAFVASLGVGGIAVALALQNVLGDLFASVAIGLDKPFEVGQVIGFGDQIGTVVHVGVKTTRIRALSGEELVISNTHLLKELIHNHSRRIERRIVFGFRVPYGTPRTRVEAIPGRVRELIEEEEEVRFDRGHFTAFGDLGPEFEFVYFVLGADFTLYRDIQQRVNLRIMALLEELDVEFAVPARQLRLGAEAPIWPLPASPGAASQPAQPRMTGTP